MTTTLDDYRATIDPPDELIEKPPAATATPDENKCAHCGKEATLRFAGHEPVFITVPGTEPCKCPNPWYLCSRCHAAWHSRCSYKVLAKGFAECGYCGAQGKVIEDLFLFQKI